MIRKHFEFVRFEHTVFALPFALSSTCPESFRGARWPNGEKP